MARQHRQGHGTATGLAALVAVAAVAFLLCFAPFDRPVVLDPATWDYMSVEMASTGMVPHRDIFVHKTPLAALLGAAGAKVSLTLGGDALTGAHAAYLLVAALGPALLFLICLKSFSLPTALAAAAFMMAFDQWPVAAVEGVRPKMATTVFGLASLLAALRGRPLSAGFFGALATWCWQPGLAFALGAMWELRGRWLYNGARLAIGAALPTAALLLWLGMSGALDDFFRQALLFNFDYIGHHARSPTGTLLHLYQLAKFWNPVEGLLLLVALAGLVLSRGQGAGLPRGLMAATLAYTAMTFVSLQAWPDTILFVPGLSALLAGGLAGIGYGWSRKRGRWTNTAIQAAIVVVALAMALSPHSKRLHPPISFDEQAAFMEGLATGLKESDSVLVVSLPEFLIHQQRRSRWPWPYLWFGVDRFADQHSPGGFKALLKGLEADPPGLMLVARRWSGEHRKDFETWARTRYRRQRVYFYPHTRRPINVYRPF
ncbi:MAG: hypothetical protein VCA74_03190 [Deltaproteobacteria bacterium]